MLFGRKIQITQHILRIRQNQSADDRSILKKLCFRIVFYWKTLQKDWKCYWNCTTVKYNYCIMLLYEVFIRQNCIIVCVNIFVFMLLNGALMNTEEKDDVLRYKRWNICIVFTIISRYFIVLEYRTIPA